MTLATLRIVSRESPLAMWQAHHVRACLHGLYPHVAVEIIGIKTKADKFLNMSLANMGGKGMFVKELEQALLKNKADLAVHSMKDVTTDMPEGLILPIILEREDPRDVLVSNNYSCLDELPAAAKLGTSSLRRQCQIKALRPDIQVLDIRGNVGTRLAKLDDGQYDALILAAAGVIRLGLVDRIKSYLDTTVMLPAIGQGALGIETRANDEEVTSMLQPLNHPVTHTCVLAERSLGRRLYGSCHVPVASYAAIKQGRLSMSALVGRLDGSEILQSCISGDPDKAEELGDTLGKELLDKGASAILADILNRGTG